MSSYLDVVLIFLRGDLCAIMHYFMFYEWDELVTQLTRCGINLKHGKMVCD